MSAARAFSPWFDRSAPRTRAWPPPSALELADVLRDVRSHDRYGHAVHACAAIVFAYFATLDQAPNGIATGILLGTWFARVLRFPVLLTALFRWPAFWFGFAWCAWSAITVAWSPMGAGAFKLLAAQRLLLVALAIWPVLDRARAIAWALVAAAATNSAVQIAQKFGVLLPAQGATWRPAGLAALPAVASICAGGAILVATGLWCGASRAARVAIGLAMMLCAAGIALAASRQPALALVLVLPTLVVALIAWRHARPRDVAKAAVPLILLAIAAIALFGRDFLRYLSETPAGLSGAKGFSSIGLRLYWWRICLEQVPAHPLVGSGVGSFRSIVAAHPETARMITDTGISQGEVLAVHPHSSYVRALLEGGIVGLAALVGMMLALLRAAIGNARRDAVCAGAAAALAFVFLAMTTECVELMNLAFAHAAVVAALAALPRADGYSLPQRGV